MPRQNRVTPDSRLIATPARGMFMGNRGCLHDEAGNIRRTYANRRWIICVLEFKDRRSAQAYSSAMRHGTARHSRLACEALSIHFSEEQCSCEQYSFRVISFAKQFL